MRSLDIHFQWQLFFADNWSRSPLPSSAIAAFVLNYAAGATKTSAYHHVMGTSTVTANGDLAPNAGAYPTSNQDVYCVSCHTDHNYFNSNMAANLRRDIANSSGAATASSDFVAGSSPYGFTARNVGALWAMWPTSTQEVCHGTPFSRRSTRMRRPCGEGA